MLEKYPFTKEGLEAIRKSSYALQLHFANRCNLSCSYCVGNMNKPENHGLPTIIDRIGKEEYFDIIYNKLKGLSNIVISIGGSGEVILSPYFPYFFDLMWKLDCRFQINTNLHDITPILQVFAGKQGLKERVNFCASYHLGIYLDRGVDREFYFENVSKILEFGVRLGLVTPLTPEILHNKNIYIRDWNRIKAMEKYSNQITNDAAELYHIYKEKQYPSSYTKEEWKILRSILLEVGASRRFIQETDNPTTLETLNLQGAECLLPSKICIIDTDGRVKRCDSITTEQYIYDESVKIFEDENFICPAKSCNCKVQGILYCLNPRGMTINDYERETQGREK